MRPPPDALRPAVFFLAPGTGGGVYTEAEERRRWPMFRGGGGCWILGVCGVALGSGILIAAIFPVGALLFLVAFLLIGCGCACCRR